MATSATVGGTECSFTDNGVFHFRVQFYLDEFFTRLQFEAASEKNPEHFLVNGQPVSASGVPGIVGQCYNLTYVATKDFLATKNLLDQVLYIKIDTVLTNLL